MSKVARKNAARGASKAEAPRKRPAPPPTPEKAVGDYSAAIKLFHKGEFAKAKSQFGEILERYPDEKEICDRARAYIAVCERNLQTQAPRLKNADEHCTYGVYLLNRGQHQEAAAIFDKALEMEPGNDKALYGRACALVGGGRTDQALECLRASIRANPANRLLARNDQDLEPVRQDPRFQELLEERGEGEV